MKTGRIELTADRRQVSTLDELAAKLKDMYKWDRYSACNDRIEFQVGEECGWIDPDGFASKADSGEHWDEYGVDWDGDFDGWSSHVWVSDRNGRLVMVHD